MSLPTPYYEDETTRIFCGDAREILPDVPAFDLLITDPPYQSLDVSVSNGTTTRLVGLDSFPGKRLAASDGRKWFVTIPDEELTGILLSLIARLPDHGAAYIFADVKTGLRVYPALPVANVLVWDKMKIGMGYSWRRMHEWIAYCPQSAHKLRSDARGDIIRCSGVFDKSHPTEKPPGALAPLICNSSDEDDTILDPFAGSGTTLVAAKLAGRKSIGIEISEAYCAIAAQRLKQGVLFGGLAPAGSEGR